MRLNMRSDLLSSCLRVLPRIHSNHHRNYFNPTKSRVKKQTYPDRVHLIDGEAIKIVVDTISQDLSTEKAVIIEACPGPGLLIEALIKAGATKVRGFLGDSSPYRSVLESLKNRYPDRLELAEFDLIHIKRTISADDDIEYSKDILDKAFGASIVQWSDDPPMKIIITLTPNNEKMFLRRIFSELALQTGIYAFGRTQIFAFISGREYEFIKRESNVKAYYRFFPYILYHTFFDIVHIKAFNWDCLHPVIKMKKSINFDWENVHLISLTPKIDLPSMIPPEEWSKYVYFVKQTMARRRNRIIPFMEKLVPDCGPKLIKRGITLFETFGDLEPQEFVDLFEEIRGWPEFELSNLGLAAREFEANSDDSLSQPRNLPDYSMDAHLSLGHFRPK